MIDDCGRFCVLFSLICIAVSCSPVTTQQRIQGDISGFAALSATDQAAVRRGEIQEGMSPKAVQFILGRPSEVYRGKMQQKQTMRWNYIALRSEWMLTDSSPAMIVNRRPFYFMPPTTIEIVHLPKPVATVFFIDDKVKSWERMQ